MANFHSGIDLIIANIGVSFESLVCLVFFLGGLLFYSNNFLRGLLMHFFMFSGIIMWFYQMQLNTTLPISLSLIFLVLMIVTLYSVSAANKPYGSGFV